MRILLLLALGACGTEVSIPSPSPDAGFRESLDPTQATSYVCQAYIDCGGQKVITEIEFCPYDQTAIEGARRNWILQCENTTPCVEAYVCQVEACYSTHLPCTP